MNNIWGIIFGGVVVFLGFLIVNKYIYDPVNAYLFGGFVILILSLVDKK
jgi:hypothetical protein